MNSLHQIERYVSKEIRTQIAERYLVPINVQARLEQAVHDPLMHQDPEHDLPFFAAPPIRLNPELIPAQTPGSPVGACYTVIVFAQYDRRLAHARG